MADIAINPDTQRQIDRYIASPAQVVAVSGPDGAGQSYVAQLLAAGLLGIGSQQVGQSPFVIPIGLPKDKKEIPIEAVRELIGRLRVKAAGRRIVIIDPADKATREAQNSLLKTLEQTPGETYFILAISRSMLPTVMSRAQTIVVKPVTLEQARQHYQRPSQAITTAWNLSEGAAELLHQLVTADKLSDDGALEAAKQFVTANPYERTIQVERLSKDRQVCLDFLGALAKILKALHHAQIKKTGGVKSGQFVAARRAVNAAIDSVSGSGSAKLALLNLVVNMTV